MIHKCHGSGGNQVLLFVGVVWLKLYGPLNLNYWGVLVFHNPALFILSLCFFFIIKLWYHHFIVQSSGIWSLYISYETQVMAPSEHACFWHAFKFINGIRSGTRTRACASTRRLVRKILSIQSTYGLATANTETRSVEAANLWNYALLHSHRCKFSWCWCSSSWRSWVC